MSYTLHTGDSLRLGRTAIGIELNPDYAQIARARVESLNHKETV